MSRGARKLALAWIALAALSFSTACQSVSFFEPVSPWERETLSRPGMAWDSDRLLAALRAHVFFSKEAARGGAGGSGGGCGCN